MKPSSRLSALPGPHSPTFLFLFLAKNTQRLEMEKYPCSPGSGGSSFAFSSCLSPGSFSCGLSAPAALVQPHFPELCPGEVPPPHFWACLACPGPLCGGGSFFSRSSVHSPVMAADPRHLQVFNELDQAGSLLAKETLADGLPVHDGKGDVRKCPYYSGEQDKGRSHVSCTPPPNPGLGVSVPPLMPCLLVLPCRCPGGQQLPLPNSPGCAEQAQPPVPSGGQRGPGCQPLGLVLHVKDLPQHAGAPPDQWPTPTSTHNRTTTSGDFFLMLGLRKQAPNKSQMLKPACQHLVCGPDAELGAGPPRCSP